MLKWFVWAVLVVAAFLSRYFLSQENGMLLVSKSSCSTAIMKKGLLIPLKATQGSVESNEDHAYKALAGTSIAAATLAFLSPLAFIDWWLLAVPAAGFVSVWLPYGTLSNVLIFSQVTG